MAEATPAADEGGENKSIAIVKLSRKNPYGDCTGPLGFPMQSKQAFEAESALKKQPSEIRKLYRATVCGMDGKEIVVDGYVRRSMIAKEMTFSEGEHADISVITSDSKDRDDDVLMPRGANWDHFRKNPVVPFAHNYQHLPVGRSQWVTMAKVGNGEGWKAKTQYTARPEAHPADAEWFPDTVWHFVKSMYLPGKSIGFIPQNMRGATNTETESRPDWKDARLIDQYLALEYSPVPVPSNQDALVDAVAKCAVEGRKIAREFLDVLGLVIPETIAKDRAPLSAGDAVDAMPDCPKCMSNEKVESVDSYSGDKPLFRCMNCGTHFHGDLESPELEGDEDEEKTFISPETLKRAIERKARASLPPMDEEIGKRFADHLMRNLGAP